MTHKYNHNRPLSDFQENLNKIISQGFNPIAVTQLFFEDIFVFKTKKEAQDAYFLLKNEICGYFYDEEDFLKEIKDYQENLQILVLIYWLK